MYCTNCGNKVEKEDKFCTRCGQAIQREIPQQTAHQPKKKSYKKMISVILILLILVGGGWGSYLRYQNRQIDKVVEEQLQALQNHDIPKAYSYTSQVFQSKMSQQQFNDFAESFSSFYHNQSVSIDERHVEDNLALLITTVTAKNGTVIPVNFQLVKEEGKWKILEIQIKT